MAITARQIITSALTYGLNRLSPGETLDDDLASVALSALNEIADEWSGENFMLWRDVLVNSGTTLIGITGTLGTTWAGIDPGQDILGVTYNNGQFDYPLSPLTMEQYHEEIRNKNLAGGLPQFWAYDNESTIFFYPACTGQTITLRVKQPISEFTGLDVAVTMPNGYLSAFGAVLAEKLAPSVVGQIPPNVARASSLAKLRILGQNMQPAIISNNGVRGNIFTGFR